jgi:serine protease Do
LTYKTNSGDNTYVPLRAVLDMMGAKTEWDGKKANVTINKWDVERLDAFIKTQYSVFIVKAEAPGNTISQGSGFAVLDGSYVVTNAHVVKDDKDKVVQVKNLIEQMYNNFNVVYRDDAKDIAILNGENNMQSHYAPLKLGDSDEVKPGDGVISFGFPFATVSAIQCQTDTGEVTEIMNYNGIKYIKSSLLSWPGTSGGILMNDDGEVIGVTSGQGEDLSISVSVPINEVKALLSILN